MNYKGFIKGLSFLLSFSALSSCDYFVKEKPLHAVARVGDKYLYREDIAAVLPTGYTKEDSVNIAQKYINNWAVRELMLTKASRNVSDEEKENFERLVNDYRTDLYINSYKESLISNSIDTVVNSDEMRFFYEENKEIFVLNESLVKLRYLQFPQDEKPKRLKTFEEKLKKFGKEERKELDSLSVQFISSYLNDSVWVKTESVVKKLPFLDRNLQENRQVFVNHKDSTGVYLVQVLDVLRKKELAPIEYVKPTLRQIILNQRKLEFVDKLETDIINTGIKKKQFEIIYE